MAEVDYIAVSILCLLCLYQAEGSNFRHVGCFKVSPMTEGLRFNYGTLRLAQCASGCNREGYAFIGLRQGRDCCCMNKYGDAGTAAFSAMCNYTCSVDGSTFLCGGSGYEDVYYAVDTDSQTVRERGTVLHDESKTFKDARMACVTANGDLPIIVNQPHLVSVWDIAKQANSSAVWIGAYKTSWSGGSFLWAGLNLDPNALLDLTVNSTWWSNSNTFVGDCLVLMTADMTLKTAPCTDSYPYICHQVPPPPTTPPPTAQPTEAPTDEGSGEPGDWSKEQMQLALIIVLPLFFIVTCGSCFGYYGYRLYRYCRRQHRIQMRLNMLRKAQESEFDVDTKPLATSFHHPLVDPDSSRPVTARDVSVDQKSEKSRMLAAVHQKPTHAHVENEIGGASRSRRPIVAMVTPPPYVARAGTSSADDYGMDSRQSTAISGDFWDPQPPPDEPTHNPNYDYDNENIDFTKLSIQDILYVKMLLGDDKGRQRKRKKRRIVVA